MTSDDDIRLRTLWAWGEIVGQTGCWEHVAATGELLMSDNLVRIFGFDAGARPSADAVRAAIHPDDRSSVAKTIVRVRERGEPQVIDHRITRPDCERRYLRMTVAIRQDYGTRPEAMIGVVQDITDSRHAEREVAAHVAVAEALVEWEEPDSGAGRHLGRLAPALDCLAAILWVPSGDVLVPRVFWHGESVDPAFAQAEPAIAPLSRG
ncbi:MAG: hypothetical protein QOE60_1159, partial [Thermoleophilaceae bacterium]|nr:hypothetical protein [Thermoleophilaceae bacterium]